MRVTTGEIETLSMPTLEEVEARRKFNKFKSQSLAAYEDKLRTMNQGELYTHCAQVGLNPTGERRVCILNLISLFKQCKANVNKFEKIA